MLTKEDIKAIEGLLQPIRSDISALSKRLDSFEVRLGKFEVRLGKIETRLDKIELRLDKIELRLDKIETRLDDIEERLEKLEYVFTILKKDVHGLFSFVINLANHVNSATGIKNSGWIMEDRPIKVRKA